MEDDAAHARCLARLQDEVSGMAVELNVLERQMIEQELIIETYKALLDATWRRIEALRDRCRRAGLPDAT